MKLIFFLFLLLISACEKSDNSTWEEYNEALDNSTQSTLTTEFMALVNNHRKSLGLNPVIHNEALGIIAKTHSTDMAEGTVAFGHTGFSARCTEGKTVLGGGNLCAENVAMGQKSAQAVFTSWMNSAGHRANIEQSRVTHTGFGYKLSQTGTYYWTQIFIELE